MLDLLQRGREVQPLPGLVRRTSAAVRAELGRGGGKSDQPAPSTVRRRTERGAPGYGDRLREVLAVLVADSLTPSPVTRASAVNAEPRVLLYETDAYAITVSYAVCEDPQKVDVRGQIIPRSRAELPEGGRVTLSAKKEEVEQELSAGGDFVFENQPTELGDLSIVLADSLIWLSLPQNVCRP
jgi:hypothetical protein